MKITPSAGITGAVRAYGKSVKKLEATGNAGTDKMEISQAARELQTARKAFDALPEIRQDKVTEIKTLMTSGNYKPTAEDVIEKLLSHVGV